MRSGSSGIQARPWSRMAAVDQWVASCPPSSRAPPSMRRRPRATSASSLCPLPDTPATPTISPAKQLEADLLEADARVLVHQVDAAQLEEGRARLVGQPFTVDRWRRLGAQHQAHDRLRRRLLPQQMAGHAPAAQNGDALGAGHHLGQLVRDKQNRIAVLAAASQRWRTARPPRGGPARWSARQRSARGRRPAGS